MQTQAPLRGAVHTHIITDDTPGFRAHPGLGGAVHTQTLGRVQVSPRPGGGGVHTRTVTDHTLGFRFHPGQGRGVSSHTVTDGILGRVQGLT